MENKEHNLQDKRCECCGYMTYHREHMGCIRAAEQAQQAEPDSYVQGIEDAAMLCQKEADELLSENRHVRNSEAETRAETASKLSEMLFNVAKDAAIGRRLTVAVPRNLIEELEQCSMVMTYIGAAEEESIDSDAFEIVGKDEQGRDAYVNVSIVEWSGRTAKLLSRIYAAQLPAVSDGGWALVPIEPTAQMVDAGIGRDDDNCKFWLHPAQAYRAMLAVAPQATVPAQAAIPDELTCEDIERLRLALIWEGYNTPESLETCAASWPSLVRDLIAGVLDRKRRTQAGAQKGGA